ncbi:MAG: hypothetical protein L3K09_08125 [Thermoplasmata archaeon]|nr:hypothetical protein [Thermoplasmata archaeon]
MKLWAALYAMIWIVFLEFWLALTPIAPPVPLYLHALLGFLIVVVAYRNFALLRMTTVPGRVKRIAKATFQLSILMAILGPLVYFDVGGNLTVAFGITVNGGLRFLHFVNAVAILTQASATAIAYDMWEEREFLSETRPGEVPPAVRPAP